MADFNPDDLLDKPPPVAASMTIRPRKQADDNGPALSPVMRQILDHIAKGESGGRYNVMYGGKTFDIDKGHPREAVPIEQGPNSGKTSSAAGRYQFIGPTWDSVAKQTGRHDMSPESQDINAAFLANETYRKATGRDLEKDWESGDKSLRSGIQSALASQWESLGAGPRAGGNYRFSDAAMAEHKDAPGTDLVWMTPAQYLDLSPELSGSPFQNASGRSLLKSFNRGDEIESVPSLELDDAGAVVDQNGRHRALLAQQNDVDHIPVAIQQSGSTPPSDIQGMQGKSLQNNFPKVADMPQPPPRQAQQPASEAPKEPISLLGEIGNAIVPSAQAAESEVPVWARQAPAEQSDVPAWAKEAPPGVEPDSALLSTAKGAAAGFGNTVLAGQELLGKGLEAAGAQAPGQWLVNDARKGMANLSQEMAPDAAAHPFATGAGDFLGGMVVPMGATGKIGNALARAATAGGLAGALQPGDQNDYWANKTVQTGVGAGAGAAGNKLAGLVAPTLKAAVGKLMQEGVQLTPGQMAGGAVKRAEDAMASIPILGSAIRSAQRRSIETFNRAAVNRSLSDIGAKMPPNIVSGHDAIEFARDEFSRAYNQVLPNMTGSRDPAFMSDLNDIMLRARQKNLPGEYLDQLQHILQNEIVDRFDASGRITGDVAQKVGTQLDALTKPMQIAPNPYIQDLGRFVREADNALDNMMAAHNPTMQAAKDRIDAGYAKFKTVQRAATALGAHDGTFTPAQLKSAIRARDRSKDKAAFSTGDAMLQDLAIAAQDVLPQKVPDSGTPERAALMGLLGGAAHFEPHAAVTLAGLAVPYTAPVSRAANWAVNRLAQQPGPARNMLAGALRFALPPAAGEAVSPSAPQQANTLRSMMPMQQ